jgi:hypothetical protein
VIPVLPSAKAEGGAARAPNGSGFERLLAGALLIVAVIAIVVRLLGALGLLTTPVLVGVLVAAAIGATIVLRVRGMSWRLRWRRGVSLETLPLLAVATAAIALAIAAAYLLPVWQWDALGYHLPYVNFALQRGTFADMPDDIAYLSTYPHIVEYAFIAWRALLPDDRLVELAHLPFGLLGALAIATIARRQGARTDHAVAAGVAWLTFPAVFLQLPTNYTDVASAALLLTAAAFVLGPMDRTRILLAAVAIGLFLGSKPQAAIATALVLLVLTVRAYRAGFRAVIPVAAIVALVLGAESYVVNLVRHGNPVWPVRLSLGPINLPGRYGMSDLLQSGAAAPRTHGNVFERVAESWLTVVPPHPVFDMRIGGLGLLFLVALPVAVIRAVRARSPAIAVVAVATLATPDPAVARYILAFPGLVLALAVPAVEGLRRATRFAVFGLAALAAAHNLVVAYPGLSGDGPPLTAYVGMTSAQRQRAVGADGPPTAYLDAIAEVRPGEITVFDRWADLPYLAWPFDLSRAAARIPDDVTVEQAERIVEAADVRMLIVGDDTVAGSVVRRNPQRFVPQFHCKSSTCTVYLRRN